MILMGWQKKGRIIRGPCLSPPVLSVTLLLHALLSDTLQGGLCPWDLLVIVILVYIRNR